jgi:4-diphosphocytidyl-2-C-methyl-D-erythritol kinase
MRILAPAKINLHLRVGPPRADGFHPLLTWMTTIGLHDSIDLEPLHRDTGLRPAPAATEIKMTCTDPTLPTDDRNLVVKAAKLLRGESNHSAAIHLEKKIPHGGGLGGGSSDAAFTLLALNEFWHLEKTTAALSELAAKLGSDIPFFLHGPSSICRGRGEEVRPIASPALARWVMLILPEMSMPTPAVYKQFDTMKLGETSTIEIEPDWNQWAALSSQNLLPKLVNDLEPPAFAIEPRLAKLRADLEQQLSRPVRMSGSGSSLFTLYDTRGEAANAANLLTQKHTVKALAVEMTPTQFA